MVLNMGGRWGEGMKGKGADREADGNSQTTLMAHLGRQHVSQVGERSR
jgi:hypothetical protein